MTSASPTVPTDETARLARLRSLHLLDTPAEPRFDRIARLAAELLDVPIALMSLVDERRQWFKARVGLAAMETPRDQAFCAHAIQGHEVMVVEDATKDQRFSENPLVLGEPMIRFYAGVPIYIDHQAIGTLCAIDRRPRVLSSPQRQLLVELAEMARDEVEIRQAAFEATRTTELLRLAEEVASVGHFLVYAPSNRVHWSANAYRLHGYDPGVDPEPTIERFVSAYVPNDGERLLGALDGALDDGLGFDLELTLAREGRPKVRVMGGVQEGPEHPSSTLAVFGVLRELV